VASEVRLNQPIILIEGVDKVGKTTLATALAERLGGTVFHMTQPEPPSTYLGLVYDSSSPVIFDRSYLSTLAYNRILNRKYDANYAHMVARLFREYPVFQILLYGDPAAISARQTVDDIPVSISYQQLVFSVYGAEAGFTPVLADRENLADELFEAISWSVDNWGGGYGHPLSPQYLRGDIGMERYVSLGYATAAVRIDVDTSDEPKTPSGRRIRRLNAAALGTIYPPQILSTDGFSTVLADIQLNGVV
jgi:hypothetical protein